MRVDSYATPEDYYEFLTGSTDPIEGTTESEIEVLLHRASIIITRSTRLARFTADATGYPTDEDVAAAFAEATCAQAVWFDDSGDISGAGAGWDAISLIGVSFSKYRNSAGQGGSSASESRQSPEARDILVNSGIFNSRAVRHP